MKKLTLGSISLGAALLLGAAVYLPLESSQSCAGPDYRGRSLGAVDFQASDLRCADFSGADLTGANFDGANLRGAKFVDAVAGRASFKNASLIDADFSNAVLRKSDFSGALLQDAVFDGAVISWSSMRKARLDRATFKSTIMQRTDFSRARMIGVDLTSADSRFALFNSARMECAALSKADLTGVSFRNANLSGAKLDGIHMKEAIWTDGESINKIPGIPELQIVNRFTTGSESWSGFDYQVTDDIVSQGFYPILWEPTGGPSGRPYVWTNHHRWGVDGPDSNSVLALIYYPAMTLDLTGASIKATLRARGIMQSGATVQFFMKSASGNRFHLVGAPVNVGEKWQTFSISLPESEKLWKHTYIRNADKVETLAEAMQNIEEIGFSFLGFKDEPVGRLDMSDFKLSGFSPSNPGDECQPLQAGATAPLM